MIIKIGELNGARFIKYSNDFKKLFGKRQRCDIGTIIGALQNTINSYRKLKKEINGGTNDDNPISSQNNYGFTLKYNINKIFSYDNDLSYNQLQIQEQLKQLRNINSVDSYSITSPQISIFEKGKTSIDVIQDSVKNVSIGTPVVMDLMTSMQSSVSFEDNENGIKDVVVNSTNDGIGNLQRSISKGLGGFLERQQKQQKMEALQAIIKKSGNSQYSTLHQLINDAVTLNNDKFNIYVDKSEILVLTHPTFTKSR